MHYRGFAILLINCNSKYDHIGKLNNARIYIHSHYVYNIPAGYQLLDPSENESRDMRIICNNALEHSDNILVSFRYNVTYFNGKRRVSRRGTCAFMCEDHQSLIINRNEGTWFLNVSCDISDTILVNKLIQQLTSSRLQHVQDDRENYGIISQSA